MPPATGPIAEFTVAPNTGVNPLNVQFNFVDKRSGAVTYSKFEWDFESDGIWDTTGQNVIHTYTSPGAYDVTLRVTEAGTNAQDSLTKVAAVIVNKKLCIVPDFANRKKNQAQGLWTGAGFSTTVQFLQGSGNYTIHTQTITGGTVDPQPLGCGSPITVGP